MLERIIFIQRLFKVAVFYLWSWTVRGGHSYSVCFVFCVCLSLFFSQKVFAQYTVTRSDALQQFQNVFAEEPGKIQRVLFRKTSLSSAPVRKTHWTGKWVTASPVSTGFNATSLEKAIQQIGEMRGVYSVLVVRKGRLVVEKYFREGYRGKPHNLKSASKSLLSALTGIAISEGLLYLNQPIQEILPYDNVFIDPRKSRITVRHLLTMTTGLVPTSYQAYNSWILKKDWVKAALEREMIAEPGTHFQYSTGNTHILSGVLTAATGMSTKAYAESKLFQPMQIRLKGWDTDPNGIPLGGNNLSLIPRDMAKVGLLYLDAGEFGDQQLVPRWWVESSVRPSAIGDHEIYGRYGYLWYTHPGGEEAFVAVGYGGQYIYVSPPFDCVIVITSTLESKGLEWEKKLFTQLREGILGSLRKGTGVIMKTAGLFQPDRVQTKPQHSSQKPLQLTGEQPHVLKGKTTANVVLRQAPDSNSLRMDLVPSGIEVSVFETRNRWHRIRYKQREGWISGDYVRMTTPEVSTATSETGPVRKARTIARLNMRSGPGESHEVISILDPDTQMLIQKSKGKWLLGEAGRLKGWVYADYVAFPDESEVQLVDTSKTSLQISSELKTVGDDIQNISRRFDVFQAEQKGFETTVAAFQDELEMRRKKEEDSAATRETLTNGLAAALQEISALRVSFKEFNEKEEKLGSDLTELRTEFSENRKLAAKSEQNLKNTGAKVLAEMADISSQLQRLSEALNKINSERDGLNLEIKTLRDEVSIQRKADRKILEENLKISQDQIVSMSQSIQGAAAGQTQFKKELEAALSQLKALNQTFEASQSGQNTMRAELKEMNEQVSSIQKELNIQRLDNAKLASENKALMAQLESARSEIEALRSEKNDIVQRENKKTAEHQMAKVVRKEDSPKSGGITGKDIAHKVGESPSDTPDRSRSVGLFIRSWADAWARQDTDAYISNYSKRFRPRSGMGIEKWRQKRRQRIENPEFIELSIKDLKVAALTPNHVRVTFSQSYRSDIFKDHVLKIVELVWEDGGWKILDERSRKTR